MTPPRSLIDPSVLPALRPSLPALLIATSGATLSGVSALGAIWGVVRMIGDPTPARAVGVCVALLLSALLASGASWLAHAAEARFEARLRRTVAAHVLRLPATRLSDFTTDRLRRLVSEDVAALHHMVAHLPAELAVLIVIPACAVALLLTLAGPSALVALIPGVLAAVISLLVLPRLSAAHGAERGRVMSEITTAVDDYARGIRVFRSFGGGAGALAQYSDATQRFTTGMVAWVRRVATPAAIAIALLQAVASMAIAYAVGAGRSPEVLAATLLLSLAIVTPALRLGHGLDYVAAGRAAATRIGELLAEPTLDDGAAEAPTGTVTVEVDALSHSADGRMLLAPLTTRFPAASLTAVTGPSGAGKSTLLRILAGLDIPTQGQVRIGGTPVTKLSERGRADAVLLIPQAVAPLPGSVRDNLSILAPHATDASARDALARAGLEIPLDTSADILSGGERQRLALARAFLTTARVILADEPTGALDARNADRVWQELSSLARAGHTVVVVTHDAALAARADQRVTIAPVDIPHASPTHAGGTR
ncbi:ABC transporter ATP-binding protein [Leucobacter sp. 7(1)]|uniref:ATP-binding cassette domain-containing protein n=1 Tax=Leucobacter sp. 7(1) TaxID=1255613 RepID=UPI001595E5A1|nr:ABC transporter ATP-binding protein [Leucobacter sp. 7(1)]